MKFKSFFTALCIGMLATGQVAGADAFSSASDDLKEMVKDMQKTMSQMQQTIEMQNAKINMLEDKQNQVKMMSSVQPTSSGESAPVMTDKEFEDRLGLATGGASKWLKGLTFKGDLRLRYEGFSFSNDSFGRTRDRNRFRVRLRLGAEKKLSPEMKVGFGLSTGSLTDPISQNQTLTGLFTYKDILIDKAYATYEPKWAQVGPIKKAEITGGKFANPFEKASTDMVFDPDLRPEGLYEKFDATWIDNRDFKLTSFLTLGQLLLVENSGINDSQMYAFQGGIETTFYTPLMERPVRWMLAPSYYHYQHFADSSNFGTAVGNSNNVTPTTQLDAKAFKIFETYSEIEMYPYGSIPVRPFVDLAWNIAAHSPDGSVGTGERGARSFGVKLGKVSKKGDLELSYAYKWIPANAVVGNFSDSDFSAAGGTGKAGSVFKMGYALTDDLSLNGAMFFVNNLNDNTNSIPDQRTDRFQVDLVWKF
jgi:hypothetical protein